MLGIESQRFLRPDIEKPCVKSGWKRGREKASPSGNGLAGRIHVGVDAALRAPAIRGNFADASTAAAEQTPKAFCVGTIWRKSTADPDYAYRIVGRENDSLLPNQTIELIMAPQIGRRPVARM